MGIYDRDYTQIEGGSPTPFKLAWPKTAVAQIILLCVAIVLADGIATLFVAPSQNAGYFHFMTQYMAASPQSLVRPTLWWQLLTAGFAHSPESLTHVAFNIFGLFV